MDPVLGPLSDPLSLNTDLSVDSSVASRAIVAGRYVEGDIDKIRVPRGRDLVLLPDIAPDYANELSALIQKTPVRHGLTPRSLDDLLYTFSSAMPCANEQESACRDAWLEDVYGLYEWYKAAFLISSANVTIMTLTEQPTHLDGPLVKDFHVDMPTPKGVSSALLVKAFPAPGLLYAAIEQEPQQLPGILEQHVKLLSRLNSQDLNQEEDGWKSLDEERRTLSSQILRCLDQSTITSVPDYFAVLYNGSYRYGLIHCSPETPLRRAIVTISGYSYRGTPRSNHRGSHVR